jgi:hypothetical protein
VPALQAAAVAIGSEMEENSWRSTESHRLEAD